LHGADGHNGGQDWEKKKQGVNSKGLPNADEANDTIAHKVVSETRKQ
jgi:hypothetical protein